MPICRLCVHPEARTLARAIRAGCSVRILARRYDVPKSTMHRHTTHVARRVQGQRTGQAKGQATASPPDARDLIAVQTLLAEVHTRLGEQNTTESLRSMLQCVEQLVTILVAVHTPESRPTSGTGCRR